MQHAWLIIAHNEFGVLQKLISMLDDGRSDFWMECARKSREFLHKCVDQNTALNGDQCQYDGSEMQGFRFPGRPQGQQQGAP